MPAAGFIPVEHTFHGLRPFQGRRDLAPVADLIETCFSATLDAGGRSAIQEMRVISRSGPLVWTVGRLSRVIPLMQGFVWVEAGRIVGNISVTPAGYDGGWVIANVAVAPEYRRQGIARQLMQAAMSQIARQGAFAVLQVDADNDGARTLYDSLGFRAQRTFTRWRRAAHYRLPDAPPVSPGLRRLAASDSDALYTLANRIRPNEQGGMGWLRPTRRADFHPARLRSLRLLLGGQHTEYWIVPGANGTLDAALRIESRIGGLTTLFDMLVRPECQGALAPALIPTVIQQWSARQHPLVTDHPADDTEVNALLNQHYFRPERSLVHMIWNAPECH